MNIDYHGEKQLWTFPLTEQQRAYIEKRMAHAEYVPVMVVIPADAGDVPNLVLAFPSTEAALREQCGEDCESFWIRFGQMLASDFHQLSEHTGW